MKLLRSLLLGLLLAGDLSLAQEEDGVEEPAEEVAAEVDEAAAEEVAEPESPGTEVGPPDNRQPCAMWMGGGVPGTSGHSEKQGRDGRNGHDSPRGEKGDTGEPSGNGEPGDKGPPGPRGAVGLTDPVPASNVAIHFNKFVQNEQRHYDDVSGKFHCSLLGVYFFTYHLTVYTKDPRVNLFKNDKLIMFTYDQYHKGNVDQASGGYHTEAGVWGRGVAADLWRRLGGGVGGVYADNTNDSIFSGFLLHPDMGASEARRRLHSVELGRY
uniref:Adiponectin, C1Q and collagen domain containing, b n=1 Tax=Salmo trutta TaxID=8032 RepID=A0A673X584_SALTR